MGTARLRSRGKDDSRFYLIMEVPIDAREARSPWPAHWTPTGRQQPRVDHDDHDYTQNDHAISGGDGVPQHGGGKPMICAKYVFRCFKWLERAGDALTGAAGPLFVFLAVILLSVGAFCFCKKNLASRTSWIYSARSWCGRPC